MSRRKTTNLEKLHNDSLISMEGTVQRTLSLFGIPRIPDRIPTVKLKIPGKAFLKSESRTSVTFVSRNFQFYRRDPNSRRRKKEWAGTLGINISYCRILAKLQYEPQEIEPRINRMPTSSCEIFILRLIFCGSYCTLVQ